MRAFLSYIAVADILISVFDHHMHVYLRMADFSLVVSMCVCVLIPSSSSFLFIYSAQHNKTFKLTIQMTFASSSFSPV